MHKNITFSSSLIHRIKFVVHINMNNVFFEFRPLMNGIYLEKKINCHHTRCINDCVNAG